MNKASRIIREFIASGDTALHLDFINLTEVPPLPDFIKGLYITSNELTKLPEELPRSLENLRCSANYITKLPDKLPCTLKSLQCDYNHLKKLPQLPDSLTYLDCRYNDLEKLPDRLPSSLELLWCSGNHKIKKLPDILPDSLQELWCDCNSITELPNKLPDGLRIFAVSGKYLHIPKHVAERFKIEETPNYNKYAKILQNRWKERKRLQHLRYLKSLRDHAMVFLLRPGNYFYLLLKEKNKDIFI